MKKIFFIVAVAFLITGCGANTGHQFLEKMSHSEISDKLVRHQTSKKQVRESFGEPEDIDMQDDGGET